MYRCTQCSAGYHRRVPICSVGCFVISLFCCSLYSGISNTWLVGQIWPVKPYVPASAPHTTCDTWSWFRAVHGRSMVGWDQAPGQTCMLDPEHRAVLAQVLHISSEVLWGVCCMLCLFWMDPVYWLWHVGLVCGPDLTYTSALGPDEFYTCALI